MSGWWLDGWPSALGPVLLTAVCGSWKQRRRLSVPVVKQEAAPHHKHSVQRLSFSFCCGLRPKHCLTTCLLLSIRFDFAFWKWKPSFPLETGRLNVLLSLNGQPAACCKGNWRREPTNKIWFVFLCSDELLLFVTWREISAVRNRQRNDECLFCSCRLN